MKPSKPPAPPLVRGVDGGTAALSGFLYQMLGGAAICAAAYQEPRTTGSEYEALISLARESDVYQEVFDQDTVLEPLLKAAGQGTVLVQFKHSSAGSGNPMLPGELKTIAKQLAKAAVRVGATGRMVGAYFLVTNRSLGDGARDLFSPATPASRLPKASREVLGKLRVVSEVSAPGWIDVLETFAARYGLLRPEIEDGIGRIIARLFRQGAGSLAGSPLRLEHLVEALTGSADASSLVRTSMNVQMERELSRLDPEHTGKLVRRKILDRVMRETPDRALIVFSGRGGMGKTASLYAWASELSAATSGPVRPLVAAATTPDLPGNWPDALLSDWRNLHASGPERIDFDSIVERLKIANPDLTAPLLHLCLDGLDEHGDDHSQKEKIRRLLRWFAEKDRTYQKEKLTPVMRLVVTCRDKSQLSREWLGNSSGFLGSGKNAPLAFVFDRFSEEEFSEVVRENLPSLQSRLLTRPVKLSTHSVMMAEFLEDEPMDASGLVAKPASDELIDVLHDPAMWRSFFELGPDDREAVLDDDRQARLKMGACFIRRFCEKLASRTHLATEDALPTLRAIATACRGQARRFLKATEWLSAARAVGILEPSQADRLRKEACSGGLIDTNDQSEWQWRNGIIEDALLFSPDLT